MFKCKLCGQLTEDFNWCIYCRFEEKRKKEEKL